MDQKNHLCRPQLCLSCIIIEFSKKIEKFIFRWLPRDFKNNDGKCCCCHQDAATFHGFEKSSLKIFLKESDINLCPYHCDALEHDLNRYVDSVLPEFLNSKQVH